MWARYLQQCSAEGMKRACRQSSRAMVSRRACMQACQVIQSHTSTALHLRQSYRLSWLCWLPACLILYIQHNEHLTQLLMSCLMWCTRQAQYITAWFANGRLAFVKPPACYKAKTRLLLTTRMEVAAQRHQHHTVLVAPRHPQLQVPC